MTADREPVGLAMAKIEPLEPGIYSPTEVPMARYLADTLCETPTLSNSVAAILVNRMPAHAREKHRRLNPDYERESKESFDLGSACHDWLLGDGATVEWLDFNDWRTADAKTARDEARASGMVPMLEKHRAKVEAVCAQAKTQIKALPIWSEWCTAHNELTIIKVVDGAWCRCRPDRRSVGGEAGHVFHYKTTIADASTFEPIYTRMQYDFTAAWYQRLCGGRQIFLVQEMQAPYLLQAYEPTEGSLALSAQKVQYALDLWKRCLARNVWPGYPPEIRPIAPNEWREEEWAGRALDGEFTQEAIDAYLDACKEVMAA